ncbi:MAG: hypothetical protein IJA23_06600 [Clostridia bacterium]|nr:hypothetical protein [Clostridia bacterium]
MHIKSNIEHNVIDVVILAICPLILIMDNASSALYYIFATAFCFVISAIICLMLNKFLSKTMKVFITAVLSTFLITIFNYLIQEYSILGLSASDQNYYAILSTIVMSIDIYYIDIKAAVNNYFVRVLNSILIYAIISLVFVVVKEFLSFGTLFNWKPFAYSGYAFFETVTFSFIWLALLCAVSEIIFRKISKYLEQKNMAYAKLLKQVKNERVFQYDSLRRQKLLASEVEIKYIDNEEFEEIVDKDNKNESLADLDDSNKDEGEQVEKTSTIKKKSRLKVSKETKVQQVFDKEKKEGKK